MLFLDTAGWRKVRDQQILAELAVYAWVGRLLGLQEDAFGCCPQEPGFWQRDTLVHSWICI